MTKDTFLFVITEVHMDKKRQQQLREMRRRQVRRQKMMLAGIVAVIVILIIIIAAVNGARSKKRAAEEAAKAQAAQEVSTEAEPQIGDATLFAVGDIMIGRQLRENYSSNGISGILTDTLRSEMNQADVCIANEEFAFTTNEEEFPDKEYNYKLDPSLVSTFTDMGIDLVTLANNHALDYMEQGLVDSIETLKNAGIQYAGAGKGIEEASALRTFSVNGHTIGVLAASRVLPELTWSADEGTFETAMFSAYDPEKLYQAIEQADSQCDFLIVYTHWGQMNTTELTDYQTEQAHNYVEKGADLVLGAHPHIPQGIEYYNGVPIFYSLGNFMFTGNDGDQFALKVTIGPDSKPVCQLVPVTSEDGLTKEMTSDAAADFYDHMNSISNGASVGSDGMVTQTASTDTTDNTSDEDADAAESDSDSEDSESDDAQTEESADTQSDESSDDQTTSESSSSSNSSSSDSSNSSQNNDGLIVDTDADDTSDSDSTDDSDDTADESNTDSGSGTTSDTSSSSNSSDSTTVYDDARDDTPGYNHSGPDDTTEN